MKATFWPRSKSSKPARLYVSQSAVDGESIHKVEENLWQRLLDIGRHSLQGFVQRQGDGDVGETLTLEDGRTLKRLDNLHPRRYVSVFGLIDIPRRVYGTRETQKFQAAPLDARLDLPESDFSYMLMERTGMHWRVEGAQAMLDLRATYLNGDWDAFCAFRIEQETERLYPYRQVLGHIEWKLAG